MNKKNIDCEKPNQKKNHPVEPRLEQDDRYPGSFFRVPAPPIPGKTKWRVT